MVTTQLHHDIAAYRTLPLNAYEKVAIINAVLISRWTCRGLFLGNTSRMALWDDILLHYIRDTPAIEQQMNKHRLTTNLTHGGLGLRQLWWSYITRWITLGQQELQNNGPTQQLTATQYKYIDAVRAVRCHTLTRQNQGILTPNEVLFPSWLLAPISVDDFESLQASLPYLPIPLSDELSIGLVLFNFVWAHNIFHAPTEGVYRQVFGFSMGTNCAAPWANLILRYYERVNCFDKPEHPPIGVARFIDDVCLVHPWSHTPHVVSHLKSVFPPHLPFTVDVVGVTRGFNFLDVRVVSISSLIPCVHFKETHSFNYIPFNSDTPVHIRRGWIHGECVRYLRLNSHSAFYTACLRRLRLALLRLGYPSSWFSHFPLAWSSRHMYMHRKMRPPREVVHVFKLNYNGVIRVNWGKPVKSLCYNLRQVMPALRLFCILQPSLNLRRRFHGAKIRSLLALERRIMRQVDIVDMPTQELLLNLR